MRPWCDERRKTFLRAMMLRTIFAFVQRSMKRECFMRVCLSHWLLMSSAWWRMSSSWRRAWRM